MNPRAAARRTFAALRFHNYRLYFFSQIVSFSGTWMQSVALAWLVLTLTGSGAALGTVLAAQFLPTLIFAPIGGVLADRFDKRNLIITTQAAAGALALLMGVLTLSGSIEMWMIYVLAIGFGTVTAIDNPGRQTFVMEMVGHDDVTNAVTLNSVVVNAARAIGPAVAGVVIATLGVGECFILNGLSYGAVVLALLAIRRSELHPTVRSTRAPGQLREGFAYVWRTPELRTVIIMLVIIGTLTYEFSTTLPMLSDFVFDAGPMGLAWMTGLMGVGAVVIGLVIAAAGKPTPIRLIAIALIFGLSVLVTAAMPTLNLVLVMMPIVGAASVGIITTSNALLQLNSAPQLRGRVMAMFSMALMGSTPIGGPLIGLIGDHVGPRWALAVGGFAAVAAAMYGWSVLTHELQPARPRNTAAA